MSEKVLGYGTLNTPEDWVKAGLIPKNNGPMPELPTPIFVYSGSCRKVFAPAAQSIEKNGNRFNRFVWIGRWYPYRVDRYRVGRIDKYRPHQGKQEMARRARRG